MPKLIIYDLDDTLIYDSARSRNKKGKPTFALCKDTLEILNICKENNIHMAIASFNSRAEEIVEEFGLSHMFVHVRGNPTKEYLVDKRPMIKDIIEIYKERHGNINHSDVLFFDDMPTNTLDVAKLGVICHTVDWKKGIQLSDLRKYVS